MVVNLSEVLNAVGMQVTREIPLEMTSFESRMGSFEITTKSPVSFLFSNAGIGRVKIEGSVSLTFAASCDRCLKDVSTVMELSFERTAAALGTEDEEAEELPLAEECGLDTEAFVHNEILMNWPTKILCREDCRGICPVCGHDRNEGECGCDTFVPDPRMAVIQDIFNKNKEV